MRHTPMDSGHHERQTTLIPRSISIALAGVALVATMGGARAAQTYHVSGEDDYRIGAAMPVSRIVYEGTERLDVTLGADRRWHFGVQAHYTRTAEAGKADARAGFVQVLETDGSFADVADNDPDFLTILNQPFAIELDPTTMRDLRSLRGPIPFAAASPLGGDVLHGLLRPAAGGAVDGRPVAAIHFEADGPMAGVLPKRAGASVDGIVRMDGTAYYAIGGRLLLALQATLTIDGTLHQNGNAVPVHIVYKRSIRAEHPVPAPTASPSAPPS